MLERLFAGKDRFFPKMMLFSAAFLGLAKEIRFGGQIRRTVGTSKSKAKGRGLTSSLFLLLSDGASSRRAFFEKGATALATGAAIAASPAAANAYSVPDLPYPFEALEPYIDTPTMK